MKTYIITRFSILDTNSNSWVITRKNKNIEELKNNLFSENRLNEKMLAFEKITYKSIINQTNQNFIWLIFISSILPKKYKKILYDMKKDNIKIIEVNNINEFNKYISSFDYEKDYSTVRLDDDDGLNINFVEKLNYFYNKSDNKSEIYSLVNGHKITIKNGDIYLENNIFKYKKIAIGLTKFNGNIYSCGNHTRVDENNKVIYDEDDNMFLIYSSKICDTKREFNISESAKIEDIISYIK